MILYNKNGNVWPFSFQKEIKQNILGGIAFQ